MNDLEAHGKKDRPINKFAQEVRKRTALVQTEKIDKTWGGSNVMWYGDMEIFNNYTVGDFMNNPKGSYTKAR